MHAFLELSIGECCVIYIMLSLNCPLRKFVSHIIHFNCRLRMMGSHIVYLKSRLMVTVTYIVSSNCRLARIVL